MKVKIKTLTDKAKIPEYQTKGSAGFDFHSIDKVKVDAGTTKVIRTGIALDIPEGYELQIRPRSGLSAKTPLRIANAPGTIDSDYKEEILIIVDNISNNQANSYVINEGDRIAQGVLCKVEQAELELSNIFSSTERKGGLGSTGI